MNEYLKKKADQGFDKQMSSKQNSRALPIINIKFSFTEWPILILL